MNGINIELHAPTIVPIKFGTRLKTPEERALPTPIAAIIVI